MQWNEIEVGVGMGMRDDLIEDGNKKYGIDADLLSCCNLNNQCQLLLGSSSYSFEALSTFSSISNSSKQLNFAALEQIGASMEGKSFLKFNFICRICFRWIV